jgi:hypothetical protein
VKIGILASRASFVYSENTESREGTMEKDRDIEREAEEFAQKVAASAKKHGFGGENYCDSQRELWLDIARRGYKRAAAEKGPAESFDPAPQP